MLSTTEKSYSKSSTTTSKQTVHNWLCGTLRETWWVKLYYNIFNNLVNATFLDKIHIYYYEYETTSSPSQVYNLKPQKGSLSQYISGVSWPSTPKTIPSHGTVFCEKICSIYVVKGVWTMLTVSMVQNSQICIEQAHDYSSHHCGVTIDTVYGWFSTAPMWIESISVPLYDFCIFGTSILTTTCIYLIRQLKYRSCTLFI